MRLLRAALVALALLLAGIPAEAANFYVSSVGYTAVPAWTSGVQKSVGAYVRQTAPALNNERVFKATSISGTGTTGVSEPVWVLTNGATTTDNAGANQIVWTEVTGTEANQSAGNWTAPAARVGAFPSGRVATDDTLFVSQDHAESQGSALTFPNLGAISFSIICVSRVGVSLPPTSTDKCATPLATVSTTTTNAITINPGGNVALYVYGVAFQSGTLTNQASLNFSTSSSVGGNVTLDTSSLVLNNSHINSRIAFGATSPLASPYVQLVNTTMNFGSSSQGVTINTAVVDWLNTPSAILGTAPTTLFPSPSSANTGPFRVRGVDLSAITGNLFAQLSSQTQFFLANCKLNSAVTVSSSTPAAINRGMAGFIRIDNCDDTGNARNYRFAWHGGGGSAVQDATVVRPGGASDGVTPISWKITTATSNTVTGPSLGAPFVVPAPIARRQTTTGTAEVVTVEFVSSSSTALTNAQIWLDIEALTTAGVPLATVTSGRVADLIPGTATAAWPASSLCWDSAAPARQNNHAYAVGDVFQVSGTNPCRIFYVTVAGTSALSQPGAYGGAVDGTVITTDRNGGSMTVTTGFRQNMSVTVTPQMAGYLFATAKLAVAGQTINLDPKIGVVP